MWREDLTALLGQLADWAFNFLVAVGMISAVGLFALYSAGFFHWAFK